MDCLGRLDYGPLRSCSEQEPRGTSMIVDERKVRVRGRFFRTACIAAEGYEFVDDPEPFLDRLKQSEVKADMFTFLQRIPDLTPKYAEYHLEWESVAVLPIETYEKWWKCQINDKTRNMVRKTQKKGVDIRLANFDDQFVEGIVSIYNECSVRQGKPFKHFGKNFATVRTDNMSFRDRSDFIGAYFGDELIGFAKLVYLGVSASLMQIISKVSHRDKAATNGLIAKAVERCAQSGVSYLQYATWSRGSLGDFKIHHGFKRFDIPRYYVPLNGKGRVLLFLGWQRSLRDRLPESALNFLTTMRAKWYGFKHPNRKP
jgi:hypothetical protein